MNVLFLENNAEIEEALSTLTASIEYQSATRDIQQNLLSTQNQAVSIEKTANQQKQSSTTSTKISPKQQFSQMRTQQKSQTTTNFTHSLKNAPALKRKR